MDNISITIFTFSGINESRTSKHIIFAFAIQGYFLIIIFNLTLISVVLLEKALHEPMYIFLCSLCINGLFGTAGFFPKFLSDLLSDTHVISYSGCLIQNFVIFSYVLCEFTSLTVMAIDRYVAICKPLHYHTIMTAETTGKCLVFVWMFPCCTVVFFTCLTIIRPLCGSHIDKFFCQSSALEKLACKEDTFVFVLNAIFMCVITSLVSFIIISYWKIIAACRRSKSNQHKFMQTCLPHLVAFFNFVVVTLFDGINTRFHSKDFSQELHNFISVKYLVIPPFINPIIYGVNLNPIRTRA
ncbi:olfactory receptor 2G3-like [Megalops cyprinoides]|uniref:olfactory receptor 2G3-like n=1 Tax=Megalops cyprinoides TaxID=118141 RepID=UPI0018652047|nr:olfactory receptor 2G3-like [Megalops cyprinoides]